MKPTSPLSLLLFLQLASSSPVPAQHSSTLPTDCLHYYSSSCRSLLPPKPNTPPTTLSNPHFPEHQLSPETSSSAHREQEAAFQNTPITPPEGTHPSKALSASRPLVSSYLLSLANPATKPPTTNPLSKAQTSATEALPAKPTSELPDLRKEDAKRYWATLRAQASKLKPQYGDEEIVVSDGPVIPNVGQEKICSEISGRLHAGKPMLIAREYSDLMVVAIVVLFLALVVVMEAVEKCGDFTSYFCSSRRRNGRRGEIFLAEDETVAFIVKKPFHLQPAPKPRYKIDVKELEFAGEDEDTDVEGYQYDSDAYEKV